MADWYDLSLPARNRLHDIGYCPPEPVCGEDCRNCWLYATCDDPACTYELDKELEEHNEE